MPSAFVLGVPAIPDPRAAWAWIDVGVGLIGARVGGMKLTKYSHACIRLEKDGTVLVLDPGNFSELPEALYLSLIHI